MPQQVNTSKTLSTTYRYNVETLREDIIKAVAKYAQPDYRNAIWQIVNTFLPYLGLWTLMILTTVNRYPFWIILLLAVPASGFLVRIFIFFHDCCHAAFFPSRSANRVLGYIAGIPDPYRI